MGNTGNKLIAAMCYLDTVLIIIMYFNQNI